MIVGNKLSQELMDIFFFYNNDLHKNKSTYNSAPTIFCVAGEK